MLLVDGRGREPTKGFSQWVRAFHSGSTLKFAERVAMDNAYSLQQDADLADSMPAGGFVRAVVVNVTKDVACCDGSYWQNGVMRRATSSHECHEHLCVLRWHLLAQGQCATFYKQYMVRHEHVCCRCS